MKIEKVIDKIRYTLSNDDLKVGDHVYSIGHGRCIGNNDWILHELDYMDFPKYPHIIENLNYSPKYKPYEVSTNHGYSPKEVYFKIIKMEKHVIVKETMFGPNYEWVEIPLKTIE